jgi:hypothetical protein
LPRLAFISTIKASYQSESNTGFHPFDVGRSNGQMTPSESPSDLTTLSFLLLAQKKGAKKKAADFDAVHFFPDHF